jgi:hypothetical protein
MRFSVAQGAVSPLFVNGVWEIATLGEGDDCAPLVDRMRACGCRGRVGQVTSEVTAPASNGAQLETTMRGCFSNGKLEGALGAL